MQKKIKKLIFTALAVVALVAIAGCNPSFGIGAGVGVGWGHYSQSM